MDNNSTILALQEALKISPDNVPLRLHLGETFQLANRLEEAEMEYLGVLKLEANPKAKLGLGQVYFSQEDYSKSIVVLEELSEKHGSFDLYLLLTKAFLKEDAVSKAIQSYQSALRFNPEFQDAELDAKLRLSNTTIDEFEDDEEEMESRFIQRPDIKFSDVGGMEHVKREIDLKIIQPLKQPDLYKAYGKKIGGGILLYGPPGCGKTYLARATAGEVNASFISVSLDEILDMFIGNSEKNLHEIFELARQNTPCVLFFDEIDALGASRNDMKQSSGRHLINQFLQELDGMESDNEGILVLGATNTPWNLDSAFRRPGRFDRILFIPPPDAEARETIFKLKLKDKPKDGIDYSELAKKTQEHSGADIEAIIDIAIEQKLEQALKDGIPQPLETKDLSKAIKKHKPSTKEWFSSAKNFALYANESGLYDDILTYLKIKK